MVRQTETSWAIGRVHPPSSSLSSTAFSRLSYCLFFFSFRTESGRIRRGTFHSARICWIRIIFRIICHLVTFIARVHHYSFSLWQNDFYNRPSGITLLPNRRWCDFSMAFSLFRELMIIWFLMFFSCSRSIWVTHPIWTRILHSTCTSERTRDLHHPICSMKAFSSSTRMFFGRQI